MAAAAEDDGEIERGRESLKADSGAIQRLMGSPRKHKHCRSRTQASASPGGQDSLASQLPKQSSRGRADEYASYQFYPRGSGPPGSCRALLPLGRKGEKRRLFFKLPPTGPRRGHGTMGSTDFTTPYSYSLRPNAKLSLQLFAKTMDRARRGSHFLRMTRSVTLVGHSSAAAL